MPVRRKTRKMEKVKNFCRTATAEHRIPAPTDHALESRMSGGLKISREGRDGRLRRRFRVRSRVCQRPRRVRERSGSSMQQPRDGGPAQRCDQDSGDDVEPRNGCRRPAWRSPAGYSRPSATQRTPFSTPQRYRGTTRRVPHAAWKVMIPSEGCRRRCAARRRAAEEIPAKLVDDVGRSRWRSPAGYRGTATARPPDRSRRWR